MSLVNNTPSDRELDAQQLRRARKNFIVTLGAVAAAAILLVSAVVVIGKQKKETKQLQEQITQQAEQQRAKDALTEEYYALSHQLNEIYLNNPVTDSLRNLLYNEQQHVQDLLEELSQIKASDSKRIAELNKELATVRAICQGYVAQIDQLTTENMQLSEKNKELQDTNNQLSNTNRQLGKQNQQLTEIVNRASMLEVTECIVTPLNKRDRKTRSTSQIQKLQIDYTLSKNITCETGNKIIYLCIMSPQGEILQADEDAFFRFENKDVPFSVCNYFEYTGEATSGQFFWSFDSIPESGIYNADFFVDGNMIHSFPFELKK